MNREDFKYVADACKEEIAKFLEDDDRVILIVRDIKTGSMDFVGNDCLVCLFEWIQQGIKDGNIKHKGEMIGEEHDK